MKNLRQANTFVMKIFEGYPILLDVKKYMGVIYSRNEDTI